MGPKLQPRPATSSTSASSSSGSQSKMGPPSSVTGHPKARILEQEMDALQDSLKKTTVTAGQIFKFYSDANRHKVLHFVPKPPRSLTSTLASELARYDQICDTLDSKLARAIATLQRDLNREEARIKEEEERKALEKAAEEKANEQAQIVDVEMQPAETFEFKKPTLTPTGPLAGPARRQSKISLSTLHRSQFPLKLDLSSSALRLSMDEAAGMGLTALASPISLAPKSARPMAGNELPPELLAAFAASAGQNQGVDIDLTLPDSSHSIDMPGMEPHGSRRVSGDLGNTADKPIELDLDLDSTMTDLFGDVQGGDQQTDVDGLFSGAQNNASLAGGPRPSNNNMDIFNQGGADDLLASLHAQGESHNPSGTLDTSAPSPASFMANLASSVQQGNDLGLPQEMLRGDGSMDGTHGQGQPFDLNSIDISSTFGAYFETKGNEDMIAQLLGHGVGNADPGASRISDSGDATRPGESSGS
ncbi:hypothetical protein SCHPADRAFT_991780 [Schizopora paradoxa]|uniref:Uncharacterized protein n=1 Tax=Schizopora paradoxa TaxID=27342 RepID=A0A0H2S824_9AGAM|nr:hypothetical protein SCHPADRAFT_991780 [Schizopora paradoxa]